MRVAIATWDDRVSPVLDSATTLTVIEGGVDDEDRRTVRITDAGMGGRVRQIAGLGLEVLICGAVSRPLHDALAASGLEIIPFVSGEVAAVLAAFRRGELPKRSLTLPGCRCRWRGRECGGQGRWRRGSPPSVTPVSGNGLDGDPAAEASARSTERGHGPQGEVTMIVISARGETMDATVDGRFGRAPFFIAVDPKTGACQAHSNQPNLQAVQGAGIQAAQLVAGLGAAVVISGNVGPKAFRVLKAANIRAFRCDGGTVAEAVARFQAGELPELTAANVEGHWA